MKEFAWTEAIPVDTREELSAAAIEGAQLGFTTFLRLNEGDEKDRFAITWWANQIPSYWEEPVVSPEFRELLVSSAD